MLSKPMKQNVLYSETQIRTKISNSNALLLNYKEFYKNNISLAKYKLPELKSIVRQHKLIITYDKEELLITGNKVLLIERIETLFNKMKKAEIIQKNFRSWMVRYSFILNGEAVKNRSICVNDSDFVTLEPLDEIPRELFYSYKDVKDFYYGFNITSLIQMMKTKGKINNPYNREAFDIKILKNMISLYNIIQIIYPEHKDESNKVNLIVSNANISRNMTHTEGRTQTFRNFYNEFRHRNMRSNEETNNNNNTNNNNSNNTNTNSINNYTASFSSRHYEPLVNQQLLNDIVLRDNYNKIVEMRRKPMETRIQELFMEIDQLDNYTQSSWFSNLRRTEYILLYRHLTDIWRYKAQLSNEIKNKICPLFDPFTDIFAQPIYQNHNHILEDQIKLACLTIIENLVYSGIDRYHKYLGTQHALTALTMVSIEARNAMSWLYESVAV
jgi:hypothetical protein